MAVVMITCQDAPLDMLMYYDARVTCGMNGMFDTLTLRPSRGYYPFLAWHRLADLGTQVKTTVEAKDVKQPQLFACAARNAAGKLAVFIARYSDDNNVVETRKVTLNVPGNPDYAGARCHLTDSVRMYTETPLTVTSGGTAASLLSWTEGSMISRGPPVSAWCALATTAIFPLPGSIRGWNVQCGAAVSLPHTPVGLVPSGRMLQRFWCRTAWRSM